MSKGEIPILVKILAILNYVGAWFSISYSLLLLFTEGFLGLLLATIPFLNVFGLLGAIFFVLFGILMLGVGVLNIFIGRGLWEGKNWARILEIVFSCLGMLISLSYILRGQMIAGILLLLLSLVIGEYLLFNKKVKKAFNKH